MHTFFCLTQTELRATNNDINLVLDPVGDESINSEGTRNAINDGKHVCAEVFLKLSLLVEVVENNLGNSITLEHDNQALTGTTRGLIADIRDTGDLAILDQLRDLDREVVRVDLVGELGHNEAGATL